ncbi:hypothetical protein [Williamsia soli]|uniref:hypothetical protein n=1 Tax=Williamsia soli TaxID=364929 RepID=UPI001A9DF4BB|nr:hypothetical protein [Williamsia soli]
MRKTLVASASAASALAFVLVAPGQAGADVTTPLTFGISGGFLTITAPTALQTLPLVGDQAQGNITGVKVTDERRALLGVWAAKASSTAFSNGDTTIPASDVTYSSAVTAFTGVVVAVPALVPVAIASPTTIMGATGATGLNTVTWTGTVTVDLPEDITAGTYTGQVTHSVS